MSPYVTHFYTDVDILKIVYLSFQYGKKKDINVVVVKMNKYTNIPIIIFI